MTEALISEHRLVIREFVDGSQTRIELTIEGDGVDALEDDEATLGYGVAATLFHLYSNGTVLEAMKDYLGYVPESVDIRLET